MHHDTTMYSSPETTKQVIRTAVKVVPRSFDLPVVYSWPVVRVVYSRSSGCRRPVKPGFSHAKTGAWGNDRNEFRLYVNVVSSEMTFRYL